MDKSIEIVKVDQSSVDHLIHLIGELARFEHDTPPDGAARRRLESDCLAENAPFSAFLAYLEGRPVGYVLFYTTYSTFDGRRILFLEDIFVLEGLRKTGLGKKLFKFCLKEAKRQGCCCMEWRVLDWNEEAIGFYEQMGGKRKGHLVYEIDEKDFET